MQTKTDTFANSVDLDEKWTVSSGSTPFSILFLFFVFFVFLFFFYLQLTFLPTVDVSKCRDERVYFGNSGMKGLNSTIILLLIVLRRCFWCCLFLLSLMVARSLVFTDTFHMSELLFAGLHILPITPPLPCTGLSRIRLLNIPMTPRKTKSKPALYWSTGRRFKVGTWYLTPVCNEVNKIDNGCSFYYQLIL